MTTRCTRQLYHTRNPTNNNAHKDLKTNINIHKIYSFFNLGARWGRVTNATLRSLYSRGKTRYPLYRRAGGLQSRSGRVQKTSPPPGFDPRTVNRVASRYTDWAIPAPKHLWLTMKNTTINRQNNASAHWDLIPNLPKYYKKFNKIFLGTEPRQSVKVLHRFRDRSRPHFQGATDGLCENFRATRALDGMRASPVNGRSQNFHTLTRLSTR
jgi:hypothetical protein